MIVCFLTHILIPYDQPLRENKFVLPKSRYDTVSSYISLMGAAYNDVPLVYDQEFYKELIDGGKLYL